MGRVWVIRHARRFRLRFTVEWSARPSAAIATTQSVQQTQQPTSVTEARESLRR